jgi:hypothetical protein
MEGWLNRIGADRRWFVLTANTFAYFRDEVRTFTLPASCCVSYRVVPCHVWLTICVSCRACVVRVP